jgi:hypothetical protein
MKQHLSPWGDNSKRVKYTFKKKKYSPEPASEFQINSIQITFG